MASVSTHRFGTLLLPFSRHCRTSLPEKAGLYRRRQSAWKNSLSTDSGEGKKSERNLEVSASQVNRFSVRLDDDGESSQVRETTVNDYFERASILAKSTGDGGGPRWFSPVECGCPCLTGAPLLLYLPGIDGVGLGLVRHHRKLGRVFEVWCLHIPVMDQKPFTELVKLVEDIVKSEYHRSPNRPIYLVGESIGACLALAVAARNPSIDFVLVLANPATSFSRSPIHVFSISQLQVMMASLLESLPMLDPSMFCDSVGVLVNQMEDGLGHSQAAKNLLQAFHTLSSSFSVIAEILPINALMWKMEMLKNGCAHANSYIHTVKAQTLILSSGRDPFLPSQEEGDRLRLVLPKCQVRKFNDNGHFLFLEDGVDLMYTIKVTDFYRRGRCHDIVADYLPPTSSEFRRLLNENWWYDHLASPVMLSTLENGKIVRGLGGVPSDGPTLFVGYHMLMGSELFPLSVKFIAEKNTVMRGLAHPLLFYRQGKLPDVSQYDWFRLLGAVPVSGANLFKLLATNSHVLLFPGGVRESLHRKGEEYKLFWPEQTEFVRMAARFGAKIVPFGVIGEDDIGELVVDYNDMVKIPFLKKQIEELTNEGIKLRTESIGEVSNQKLHIPGILPKVPGRFYYLFGRPIETKGRREELEDKEKGQELYLEVKYEVENCLAYLKEKREHDPYRNIIPRLLYQFIHKFDSEIPTFQI